MLHDLPTEDGKTVHRAKGYSVEREELGYGLLGIFPEEVSFHATIHNERFR